MGSLKLCSLEILNFHFSKELLRLLVPALTLLAMKERAQRNKNFLQVNNKDRRTRALKHCIKRSNESKIDKFLKIEIMCYDSLCLQTESPLFYIIRSQQDQACPS